MSSSIEMNPSFQETMLEFRAGLMFLEEKRVVPDTRKGLIKVARGDEGLLHFLWLDRTSNEIEIASFSVYDQVFCLCIKFFKLLFMEINSSSFLIYISSCFLSKIPQDQIILPDEAVFEKIQQSSGRVYILKFKYDDRKFFFWMQEPKADGDSQICSSVNYFISRPIEEGEGPETSVALQTSEASDSGVMGTEVSSRDTSAIIPNSQGEAPAASTSQSRRVQLSDLQQILSNIGGAAAATQDIGPDLGDILKPELVVPLVDNFPLEDRLACHLPEGVWTREAFGDLLQSPPFRQQVDSFSYVLRTGQIDLSQFGIDPSKYAFTVTSFLEALDETVKNTMASNNTFSSQESKPEDSKDSDSDPARKKAGNDPMDERS